MTSTIRARLLPPIAGLLLAAAAPALVPASASARDHGPTVTKRVGWTPLSSRAAAKRVHRSSWEPRPGNDAANHTVPTRAELRTFQRSDPMPYARKVNGRFRGTTDEIIQWAAYKWGFPANTLRAVAVIESWWNEDTVGNDGSAFGLFQVRVPYHCCLPEIRDSTAFNADYYGAQLRAYYDGKETWLNQNPHGRVYRAGDLWGSIGTWATGDWYYPDRFFWYVNQVKQRLHERTWATDPWF